MIGDLYINGYDAHQRYGLSIEDSALAQLLTYPSAKDRVSNSSRLENGRKVINNSPKMQNREVTIPFHITDPISALQKYDLFNEEVIKAGELRIWSRYLPDREFYTLYISCSALSSYVDNQGFKIIKFSLKLEEPNPCNRILQAGDYPT